MLVLGLEVWGGIAHDVRADIHTADADSNHGVPQKIAIEACQLRVERALRGRAISPQVV